MDKNEIKESITEQQMFDFLQDLGGEPILRENNIICRTICHGGDSHKLYYFFNTRLFRCFTQCPEDSFDIFALIQKIKTRETGNQWSLPKAISYVASYFGFSTETLQEEENQIKDWNYFKNCERINDIKESRQIVELNTYDRSVLNRLPHPIITPWENEGISREVIREAEIAYDPVNEGIVIPHFDIDGRLIGIRERTLIKENEQWGKYMPAKINGILYRHPLSFNLYNLDKSKNNIKLMKKVIAFEGEKSSLLCRSYFGKENDISVAVCGSSLINYQVQLLLSLGVEEITIAFDKQFQHSGDEEFKRWTKKLTEIHKKYSPFVSISFIFDKKDLLGYKMSPIDKDKETFLQLYKERIFL